MEHLRVRRRSPMETGTSRGALTFRISRNVASRLRYGFFRVIGKSVENVTPTIGRLLEVSNLNVAPEVEVIRTYGSTGE